MKPSTLVLTLSTTTLYTLVGSNPVLKRDGPGGGGTPITGITGEACGLWATANQGDSMSSITQLMHEDVMATAAANSCSRLGCINTSGIYLCNDQDVELTIPLSDATSLANTLTACGGSGTTSLSGQIFSSNNGGYNVNIAFCDSGDAVNTPPSAYAAPGPNGPASLVCGGNDATPCNLS